MRRVIHLLIGVLVLGIAGLVAYRTLTATGADTKAAPTGVTALFAATFPDQEGRAQALSQWRGKIVVVNFWATWCPPCKEEMPELSAFQNQHAAQNVVVLGISTDDVAKIREFVKTSPTTYPLFAGDFEAMMLAESLGNTKGVLPYTVLIGPDGALSQAYFGRLDMKKLEQDVNALTSSLKQL